MAFKRGSPIPAEFLDAHILSETGWPPDVLDALPEDRLQAFLFYRQIKAVAESGGVMELA